jgi:hypothetical protein
MNVPDHFLQARKSSFLGKKIPEFLVADPDEGLNILISTFCECADRFQGLSKAFTSYLWYTIVNFLFASLKLLSNFENA